jgi:hypothetical protein
VRENPPYHGKEWTTVCRALTCLIDHGTLDDYHGPGQDDRTKWTHHFVEEFLAAAADRPLGLTQEQACEINQCGYANRRDALH